MKKLYQAIAAAVAAAENCQRDLDAGTAHESILNARAEWLPRHIERAESMVRAHLPSGSGFDSGTTLDTAESTAERLIFRTAFHHLNPLGFYDGWTDHKITVRPSLSHGFTLAIGGRDRNGIKDYIADVFQAALSIEIEESTHAH